VTLVAEAAQDVARVVADRSQLQQMIINLVFNAIEATARGGRVVVRVRNAGSHVALEISDTGAGMSAEVASRAFDPFFTTKPPGQGTGLGLAITRDIVHHHGGEISVETAPGQGATFVVRLRRAEGRAA
jgi:two-component system, NtrC family, sensor kinase